MTDIRVLAVALSLGLGCGPDAGKPATSQGSATGGETSTGTADATTSASATGTTSGVGESASTSTTQGSSESTGGGGPIDCADWDASDPLPPSSFQDCAVTQCPADEVCRYDPHEACGAHPVCVDPNRLACVCEIYGPESAGVACPCPGYRGPLNELNQAPLECNTDMSPQPVSYDLNCIL